MNQYKVIFGTGADDIILLFMAVDMAAAITFADNIVASIYRSTLTVKEIKKYEIH